MKQTFSTQVPYSPLRMICQALTAFLLIGCASSRTVIQPNDLQITDDIRMLLRKGQADSVRTILTPYKNNGSDKTVLELWARSYDSEGDRLNSTASWNEAAGAFPHTNEFRINYWKSLLELSLRDSSKSDSINELINAQGADYAVGSSLDSLELAYTAASFTGDTLAVSLSGKLISMFPGENISVDIVGEKFWDGLYPIWKDNEARISYLRDFITQYADFSWQHTARRFLLSAYTQLNDTAALIEEAERWVGEFNDNPEVLITAARYIFEVKKDHDALSDWVNDAINLKGTLAKPAHMPEEEWALYDQQLKAGMHLLAAQIMIEKDDFSGAEAQIEKSFVHAGNYGAEDYATPAAQQYIAGVISFNKKDTASAVENWTRALVAGEVRNKYPALADSSLRAVSGITADAQLLDYTRDIAGNSDEINLCKIKFLRTEKQAGLDEVSGSRFAWGDYDGDGDDDLLVNGNRLFNNNEGYFFEVTEDAGLGAAGCRGGVWGDYDNDGDVDLFCFSSSGDSSKAERLYRNNGEGKFDDVTSESGDIVDLHSTESAIWADFNNDGRLDLFVPGYERPSDDASGLGNAWRDRIIIQNPDGIFNDLTEELGIIPPDGVNLCGRSPVACDFDRDGDQDLYVGNYRLQENFLWVNNESRGFTNRADWYMVDGEEVDGWWGHTIGCQWGDFDNDGDFDLIAANLAHPRYIRFSNRTMLYRNDGSSRGFTDVRREWGIKYDECHSEPLWGDLDNDGDIELFITSVYPDRRSYLYRNDGDRFEDITWLSGSRVFNGWGSAFSDYDNDGDLDLVTRDRGKIALLKNETDGGNWLEIDIRTTQGSGSTVIGTIVELITGDGKQIRQVEGGKGAGSQSSQVVHFGIGDADSAEIKVTAGGRLCAVKSLEANVKHIVNISGKKVP